MREKQIDLAVLTNDHKKRSCNLCAAAFCYNGWGICQFITWRYQYDEKEKTQRRSTLTNHLYCKLCGIGEFAGTLNRNDDRYMVHDNVVYEKISPEKIRIDKDSIPKPVRENLATATLDFVRRMMQEPGTREEIEARIQSKKDPQQK